MRPTQSAHLHAAKHAHKPARNEGIEWEELPSLSGSLEMRLINPEVGPKTRPIVPSVLGSAWDHTLPAELDAVPTLSGPFREMMEGVSIREVYEPELFRYFFGGSGTSKA